eukprot:SAG11_NODE_3931_length_2143_cov_2.298924_1_plen_246_part_10
MTLCGLLLFSLLPPAVARAAGVGAPAVQAPGRAALLPPSWLGPFAEEYSDQDCKNVGSAKNLTPAQCAQLCDSACDRAGGCDAFNYGDGACTFRACDSAHLNATRTWPRTVSYRRRAALPVASSPPPPDPPSSWGSVGLAGNSHIRGLLNVTAPPLSIDSSGTTDVSAELQAAITLAHRLSLVVYLPLGIYLVSDTLTAYDPDPFSVVSNNTWACRFSPNVMVGQRARRGASSAAACRAGTVGAGC